MLFKMTPQFKLAVRDLDLTADINFIIVNKWETPAKQLRRRLGINCVNFLERKNGEEPDENSFQLRIQFACEAYVTCSGSI